PAAHRRATIIARRRATTTVHRPATRTRRTTTRRAILTRPTTLSPATRTRRTITTPRPATRTTRDQPLLSGSCPILESLAAEIIPGRQAFLWWQGGFRRPCASNESGRGFSFSSRHPFTVMRRICTSFRPDLG